MWVIFPQNTYKERNHDTKIIGSSVVTVSSQESKTCWKNYLFSALILVQSTVHLYFQVLCIPFLLLLHFGKTRSSWRLFVPLSSTHLPFKVPWNVIPGFISLFWVVCFIPECWWSQWVLQSAGKPNFHCHWISSLSLNDSWITLRNTGGMNFLLYRAFLLSLRLPINNFTPTPSVFLFCSFISAKILSTIAVAMPILKQSK